MAKGETAIVSKRKSKKIFLLERAKISKMEFVKFIMTIQETWRPRRSLLVLGFKISYSLYSFIEFCYLNHQCITTFCT